MALILTIQRDKVVLTDSGDVIAVIESELDLYYAADSRPVLCSSSMDFPDEYTNNVSTINLAYRLRG